VTAPTDTELRDALAPLRGAEPLDSEVAAVLAAATTDARRPRANRRSWRIAAAMAAATAAAAGALAALPGDEGTEPETAAGLLRGAAAVAADQPEPPAWAGYRYVKQIRRFTNKPLAPPKRGGPSGYNGQPTTGEQTQETWVDREWHGRSVAERGKVVDGPGDPLPAHDSPYSYADEGALAEVPLDELPTDPQRLYDLLVAAYKDLRWGRGSWAPGSPTAESLHYSVLFEVLHLLTVANTTSEQRAALIEVIGRYEGVKPLPSARDHLGREGRGVEIPVEDVLRSDRTRVQVIFSPDTSELLEWSVNGYNPGEVHTFVRFGHVAEIGDRP
jgi:hypothetical protein